METMTDIVERLRDAGHDERKADGPLYLEAAADIELLRAEVASLLRQRNKLGNEAIDDQLALISLRAERDALLRLVPLVQDVMSSHRDEDSPWHNDCDTQPCMWCVEAQDALDAAKDTA